MNLLWHMYISQWRDQWRDKPNMAVHRLHKIHRKTNPKSRMSPARLSLRDFCHLLRCTHDAWMKLLSVIKHSSLLRNPTSLCPLFPNRAAVPATSDRRLNRSIRSTERQQCFSTYIQKTAILASTFFQSSLSQQLSKACCH